MDVNKVIDAARTFYDDLKDDKNDRYRSWEHCYLDFINARINKNPDVDHLALQLAFYLASWGMYRGSSFLLQKDYKIHIPVVKEILKKEYDSLAGIDCKDYQKVDNQKKLKKINEYLNNYYSEVRETVNKDISKGISDTLITKILMGVLGCVPAYDRYFTAGIKANKVASGIYNINSILDLSNFYIQNEKALEKARTKMKLGKIKYPQMKVLDMGFFQLGMELLSDERK